jgi:hypothetical protein
MPMTSLSDEPTPDLPRTGGRQRMTRSKNNTCGTSSLNKRMTRQLAGIMAHLERHPNDGLSRARVATINGLLRR